MTVKYTNYLSGAFLFLDFPFFFVICMQILYRDTQFRQQLQLVVSYVVISCSEVTAFVSICRCGGQQAGFPSLPYRALRAVHSQ
jgi:hypothetical protein